MESKKRNILVGPYTLNKTTNNRANQCLLESALILSVEPIVKVQLATSIRRGDWND